MKKPSLLSLFRGFQILFQLGQLALETAAAERLEALAEITLLRTTSDAEQLAGALIAGHAIPESHLEDVLHIALAVVNGIQYIVMWNFRHRHPSIMRDWRQNHE